MQVAASGRTRGRLLGGVALSLGQAGGPRGSPSCRPEMAELVRPRALPPNPSRRHAPLSSHPTVQIHPEHSLRKQDVSYGLPGKSQ